MELSSTAQQLYTVSALARRGSLSKREKSLLKDLILSKDSKVADTILGEAATDFAKVLRTLRDCAEAEAQRRFDAVFVDLPTSVAKSESRAEREARDLLTDESFVYGEIDYSSFVAILRQLRPKAGSTFVDLGCGSGRAAIASALLFDFSTVLGIEALGRLHSLCQQAASTLQSVLQSSQALHSDAPALEFELGSFLDLDWSHADVVFANSTCFSDSLMGKLALKAEALNPGAYVITFTRPLQSPCFRVLSQRRWSMSWGLATVYIHRRIQDGGDGDEEALEHALAQMESESSDDADSSDEDEDEDKGKTKKTSGNQDGSPELSTPPRRRSSMHLDLPTGPVAPSFAALRNPLGSPSSPQGNSLLAAKAARAARARKPASSLMRSSAPPSSGTHPEGVAGVATEDPETPGAGPRLTIRANPAVAFEMSGVMGQSSPQGDALLAAKARRARAGAARKKPTAL